jgi:hypothetical protein
MGEWLISSQIFVHFLVILLFLMFYSHSPVLQKHKPDLGITLI